MDDNDGRLTVTAQRHRKNVEKKGKTQKKNLAFCSLEVEDSKRH